MSACTVPPAGWSCSRTSGHAGPCAARSVPAGKSRTEWRKHLRAFEKSVKKRIKVERAALEGEQS